eukprot:GILI01017177.1.p1 GENE.GILI01017177.1~~GILI01017177.1.p1  ORF type:complete len:451 (-),score=113.92 GILI01017177.1:97-1449(-)
MACITGDETGVVKVWDISKKSGATMKLSFGDQNRSNGVAAMCWRDSTTREVCINRNNGVVEILDLSSKMLTCKKRLGAECVAAVSSGCAIVQSKLVVVQKDGKIRLTPVDLTRPEEVPFAETAANEMEEGEQAEVAKDDKNTNRAQRKATRKGLDTPAPSNSYSNAGVVDDGAEMPIYNDMIVEDASSYVYGRGPVDAVHIHRRLALAAVAGKENDLCIYDIASERQQPIFQARNVRDHVLDLPMPIYVVGASIVSSHVSCVATAYHEIRFYDRRANDRPVQEFTVAREIDRRPTCLVQWNCNKFLIGEASGDVHLYDTRRGFTSRAKLRGGVGSVRQMTKHPTGHQLLGVTGLDRKARIFHVPTGKMLMSLYLKQRATSVLLDRNLPMADDISSFSGITNTKQPAKTAAIGDEIWDDMDPVVDDFEEKVTVLSSNGAKKEPAVAKRLRE